MKEESTSVERREPDPTIRGAVWRWFTRSFAWEILRELYRGAFDSEPDPREKAAYLGSPRREAPPASILQGLLHSETFQRGSPAAVKASREITQGLYQGILKRDADRGGIATWEKLLREKGPIGVQDIVTGLTASKEYQARAARTPERLLPVLGPAGGRQVGDRKIAHVISLGTHCLASFYMKQYQYKRYSLPFDWLFTSPETVLHCLEDDFKEFLDPKHFISLQDRKKNPDPGAEHVFYRDLHNVNAMFNHRDPTNKEDFLYFARSVDRFRRVMTSDEAKLFVMIVRPFLDASKTYAALSAKIRSMTANSAFVCVQLRSPTFLPGCHSMREAQTDGDHSLYEFRPSSRENGLSFGEVLDDLMIIRLLRQFDMDLVDAPTVMDSN